AAKGLHGLIEVSLVKIELGAAADQCEAEPRQRPRHELRVVRGIVEFGDGLIALIADDESHTLSCVRWREQHEAEAQTGNTQETKHARTLFAEGATLSRVRGTGTKNSPLLGAGSGVFGGLT